MTVGQNLESDNRNRTGAFFVAALFITGLSYAVVVLSVHTYCENRPFAAAIALAALFDGLLLLRSWPSVALRRAVSASGVVLCLMSAAANVWFIIGATHTCKHMFDLLNK